MFNFQLMGGEMGKREFDLEDRFVDYSCRMIDVVEALPKREIICWSVN